LVPLGPCHHPATSPALTCLPSRLHAIVTAHSGTALHPHCLAPTTPNPNLATCPSLIPNRQFYCRARHYAAPIRHRGLTAHTAGREPPCTRGFVRHRLPFHARFRAAVHLQHCLHRALQLLMPRVTLFLARDDTVLRLHAGPSCALATTPRATVHVTHAAAWLCDCLPPNGSWFSRTLDARAPVWHLAARTSVPTLPILTPLPYPTPPLLWLSGLRVLHTAWRCHSLTATFCLTHYTVL